MWYNLTTPPSTPNDVCAWNSTLNQTAWRYTNVSCEPTPANNEDGRECSAYFNDPDSLPVQIWFWAVVTVCPVAIALNVITVLVLASSTTRAKSYTYTLSALALFDSVTLLLNFIEVVFNERRLQATMNNFSCKLWDWLQYSAMILSAWLVVLLTTERFVAVLFPFRAKVAFGPRQTIITIFTLMLIVGAICSFQFHFIIHGQLPNDEGRICLSYETFDHRHHVAWAISTNNNITMKRSELHLKLTLASELILTYFIPAVLICVMNCAVAYQLWKSYRASLRLQMPSGFVNSAASQQRRRSSQLHQTSSGSSVVSTPRQPHQLRRPAPPTRGRTPAPNATGVHRQRKVIQKMTMFLFIFTTCYLICILPYLALNVYIQLHTNGLDKMRAFTRVCLGIRYAEMVAFINYADNFLVFVIAGSQFRTELKTLVYRLLGVYSQRFREKHVALRRRHHRYTPANATRLTNASGHGEQAVGHGASGCDTRLNTMSSVNGTNGRQTSYNRRTDTNAATDALELTPMNRGKQRLEAIPGSLAEVSLEHTAEPPLASREIWNTCEELEDDCDYDSEGHVIIESDSV